MNQIDKIMSCVPRPTRSDVESMKSPYAQSVLEQLLRMWVYCLGSNIVHAQKSYYYDLPFALD